MAWLIQDHQQLYFLLLIQIKIYKMNLLEQRHINIYKVQIWFLFNKDCVSICGNGVLEQYDEFDDSNIHAFDGSFDCQYTCLEGCSNCNKGICFEYWMVI